MVATRRDSLREASPLKGESSPLYAHTFWIQESGFAFISAYGMLITCMRFSTLCGRQAGLGPGRREARRQPCACHGVLHLGRPAEGLGAPGGPVPGTHRQHCVPQACVPFEVQHVC